MFAETELPTDGQSHMTMGNLDSYPNDLHVFRLDQIFKMKRTNTLQDQELILDSFCFESDLCSKTRDSFTVI